MNACWKCGAVLGASARFCPACGTATRRHARAVSSLAATDRRGAHFALLALAACCAGTFAVLSATPTGVEDSSWVHLLPQIGLLVVATIAAALLGDWRGALPWRCRPRWLLLAVPAAGMTFGLAFGYVSLFGGAGAREGAPTTVSWVSAVLLAPLVEEWLCRGIAWRAIEVLARPRNAPLATAVLFAFLHGLGGGFLLELPHRFVMGLVLGWLRVRSGSLVPTACAHALHNALAIGFCGG